MMKSRILIAFFGLLILGLGTHSAQAQKKNKARLTVKYNKEMNGKAYFDIKAAARIDGKNVAVPNLELIVKNISEEGDVVIGKAVTDATGNTVFVIRDFDNLVKDEENNYNFKVEFKGNDEFSKVSKSISFVDATLITSVENKEDKNYLKAVLKDPVTNEPIAGETVTLSVDRMFEPLTIGESFYTTDENGTVIAPIDSDIPGVNGILTLQAVLDSDSYHTVIASVKAPIGVPVVDESSFDERTLWSPRDKTPVLMLVFLNLLIFGIWSILIYLTYNLVKIAKS